MRHPRDPGLRGESHLGPPCMVPRFEVVEDGGEARLVHLARRQGPRPAAEQLDIYFWVAGVAIRPRNEAVLLPLFLSGAAGPELAQSGSREGNVRRRALLVPARRGRFSPGRCGYLIRGPEPSRQPAASRQGQIRTPAAG